MGKEKIFPRLGGIALIAAFFLAACNLPEPSATAASVTDTPAASANQAAFNSTNTPLPTATDTPIPTIPATDTASPTVQLAEQVIPNVNAYCRKGPDPAYDQVTVLQQGNPYTVIGQNGQNSQNIWWQVQGQGSIVCWVADVEVTRQGPVEQAQIALAPSLPGMASNFGNSYVCTPTKTLVVKLEWKAAVGVTGYNLYRNGSLLKRAGAGSTSYNDKDAPLGVAVVYELEPFNDYGVAARLSTKVPACK